MKLTHKLKTRSVVPPSGFCFKRKDGNRSRGTVFKHVALESAQHHEETIEAANLRVERDTAAFLAESGHFDFLESRYPRLEEQGDVTIIPNEMLLPAPHNYNPGLFEVGGKLVMCYRRHLENAFSEIAVTELDTDSHLPTGKQRVLEIPKEFDNEDHEDARILWHNDEIYVTYTMWRRATLNGRWLYMPRIDVAVFDADWQFKRKFTPLFGGNTKSAEKNWTFFSHDDKLLFCYDFERHVIGEVTDEPNCRLVSTTDGISWDYGTIRGSTPPVCISDAEYLSFFHSRRMDRGAPHKNRYYAGAYCFEAKAPFRITRYTEQPVFAGSESNLQWDAQLACVFPCGLVVSGDTAIVSMGSNDMECAIARVNVPELLEKMTLV